MSCSTIFRRESKETSIRSSRLDAVGIRAYRVANHPQQKPHTMSLGGEMKQVGVWHRTPAEEALDQRGNNQCSDYAQAFKGSGMARGTSWAVSRDPKRRHPVSFVLHTLLVICEPYIRGVYSANAKVILGAVIERIRVNRINHAHTDQGEVPTDNRTCRIGT